MNCTNCNAPLPDDAVFCSECGHSVEAAPAPAPEQAFCPECGAVVAADDMFCGNCGAQFGAAAAAEVAEEIEEEPKAPRKKFPVKTLLIAAAGVVVALLAIFLITTFAGKGDKVNNYAVYLKDDEMQLTSLPKGKEPFELTSNLLDSEYDDGYYQSQLYLSSYVKMSKDGKTIFYPDKIETNDYGNIQEFTLYYRSVNNTKKEAEKVDSGLSSYSINEKGTLVTYRKDGNLYQNDLTEKNKIDSDVTSYRVSPDGKKLVYLVIEKDEESGNLYMKDGKKDAEKVASNVTGIANVNEDFSRIMYYKDDALYIKEGTKDAEKIASDVEDAWIFDSGEIYYLKEGEPVSAWDFVEDDLEEDEAGYYRESLEDTEEVIWYSLYYYNGKEAEVLSDHVIWSDITTNYGSEAMMVYPAWEGEELPTMKLSALVEDEYAAAEDLQKELMEGCGYYVATKNTSTKIEFEVEDIYDLDLSSDGKVLYVQTEYDEDDETVALYKLTLSGSKVKTSDLLDEDVADYGLRLVGDSSILYFKELNDDGEGEMYLDGEMIADDASRRNVTYDEDTGNIYYYVDWNAEKEKGTLMYTNGKKSETVKDDVHSYVLTPGNEVLFLYDYSLKSYRGELWILDGKKTTRLDDDVTAVFIVR